MTRFLNSGKEDIFYNILILFPKAHTFHWGKILFLKIFPRFLAVLNRVIKHAFQPMKKLLLYNIYIINVVYKLCNILLQNSSLN